MTDADAAAVLAAKALVANYDAWVHGQLSRPPDPGALVAALRQLIDIAERDDR